MFCTKILSLMNKQKEERVHGEQLSNFLKINPYLKKLKSHEEI